MKTLRRCLAFSLAAMSIGVAGCASDTGDGEHAHEGGDGSDHAQALQTAAESTTLANPDGVYFASVIANGTGCPAGTWHTTLAPDGQTFTTTFSAYETEVDQSRVISIKDCFLTVKLHSPEGMSYAVTKFHYAGYATLDQGVSARQFASYYFQGNPAQAAEVLTELVGPYDNSYLFSDEVPINDSVWSPCGVDRDLNVITRLRMQNTNPRGNGYMNMSALDGTGRLVLRVAWRTCTEEGASPADAGSAGGFTFL